MDVAFVLDGSRSVCCTYDSNRGGLLPGWDLTLEFVKEVVQSLEGSADAYRVGVITFSDEAWVSCLQRVTHNARTQPALATTPACSAGLHHLVLNLISTSLSLPPRFQPPHPHPNPAPPRQHRTQGRMAVRHDTQPIKVLRLFARTKVCG